MKFKSIRHKLVFFICLFVVILLFVIAEGIYHYFRHTTRKLIFAQQLSTITSMAEVLDHELTITHETLINVAKVVPANMANNLATTRKWLHNRVGVKTIFRHSLFILDNAGIVIANCPANPKFYGISLANSDYFKISLKTGKPYISAPLITMTNDHPVMMMTAPIRSAEGVLNGFLCGAIDLLDKKSLFRTISDTPIGTTGYLFLLAPEGTIIMHPNPSHIMQKDGSLDSNPLFARALRGFEGSGETSDAQGVSFLTSFKRLQSTGWILAAHYPVVEAYQPITGFRKYYLLGMFIVLLLSIVLAWMLGVLIIKPLEGFTKLIYLRAQPGAEKEQPLDSNRVNELGQGANFFFTIATECERGEKIGTASLKDIQRVLVFDDNFNNPIMAAKASENVPVVLIVEDVEMNLMLVAMMIKQWFLNVEILEAKTGKEAVDQAKTKKIDVILMDVQMPEMDGIEATKQIREWELKQGGHVPIVALTAGVLKEEAEKCMKAGMDGFLAKPIEQANLRKILEKHLSSVSTAKETLPGLEKSPENETWRHFDKKMLLQRIDNNEEGFKVLVDASHAQFSKYVESLTQAIQEKNTLEIRKIAHALKGSARNMSFNRLAELAKEIEAQTDQVEKLEPIINNIRLEWENIKTIIG